MGESGLSGSVIAGLEMLPPSQLLTRTLPRGLLVHLGGMGLGSHREKALAGFQAPRLLVLLAKSFLCCLCSLCFSVPLSHCLSGHPFILLLIDIVDGSVCWCVKSVHPS